MADSVNYYFQVKVPRNLSSQRFMAALRIAIFIDSG